MIIYFQGLQEYQLLVLWNKKDTQKFHLCKFKDIFFAKNLDIAISTQ